MKILMLTDVYFPRINGVSTSIESFRRALARRGHSVTLVCPAYPVGQVDDPGVVRIASRGVPGDPEDRMMRYRDLLALGPALAAEGFDLIHVQTPFVAHHAGLALGRRLAIPVLATYHTLFEAYLQHYVPWLPAGLLRFAARRLAVRQCRQVSQVVAPSRAMREALERYGTRTPIDVIPTGLSLESFRSSEEDPDFRSRYGFAESDRLLLFVGRAAHEKNIGFLISILPRVLAQHPEVRLVITGEGPAQVDLQRLAERTGVGDRVTFLGYLERCGPLQDAYRAAEIFVFSSRTETQGLVLLEALAMGTPVVSTAVMGTRDVLREGEGCLIASEDPEEFAERINHVLEEPVLRQRLSERGKAYAERWSEDRMAAALLRCYMRILPPC
ncbi:glycosyltransferase [Halomonas organivorans]